MGVELTGVLWCSLECTPACQAGGRGFKSRQDRKARCRGPTDFGRVAQLVERAPEKREVTGSTPVPTTEYSQVRGSGRGRCLLGAGFRAPPVPHRKWFGAPIRDFAGRLRLSPAKVRGPSGRSHFGSNRSRRAPLRGLREEPGNRSVAQSGFGDHALEAIGDLTITVGSGVLVHHGGLMTGVPESSHEFFRRCPGPSRQRSSSVT